MYISITVEISTIYRIKNINKNPYRWTEWRPEAYEGFLFKIIQMKITGLELHKVTDKINLYKGDNMDFLKQVPDKYYELAIVDPPYGIGANKMQLGNGKRKIYRGENDWDNSTPTAEYWQELFRVSKNQIIWGGNYYELKPTKCWIIWDKNNGESDFADGEMAWTSFDKPMRIKKIHWCGSASKWEDTNGKIHPTQKPSALYKWLLDKYAQKGDKILDTHGGSMSIAIACHDYDFELDLVELDDDYFNAGLDRVKNHVKQLNLFSF